MVAGGAGGGGVFDTHSRRGLFFGALCALFCLVFAAAEAEAEERAPTEPTPELATPTGEAAVRPTPGTPAGAEDAEAGAWLLPAVRVEASELSDTPEPTSLAEPTAFGTVLSARDFAGERFEAADLLLAAPGTTIRHGAGMQTLGLRGASSDQTLILLDGIRLNPAAGGGVDLRSLPAPLLDEVTVLRGNEGARFGAGALGGVVLLETRPPPAGGLEASAQASAGSFGTYGLSGAVGGGSTTLQGLAALSLSTTDGDYLAAYDPTPSYDASDETRTAVANNDLRDGALLLKGRARLGGAELSMLAQGAALERGLPGTLYTRTSSLRRHERRVLLGARATGSPSELLRLEGGLELREDRLALDSDFRSGIVDPPASPDEGARPWQIDRGLTARAAAELVPASFTLLRLEAAAGAETIESPYHGDRSRPVLSAALLDELYLGRRVTVTPAVRVDRVGEHDAVSPRLGVAYRVVAPVELRANVGRTFRPPSLSELYLEQGPLKPNPELSPERGAAADGGLVLRLPRTVVTASAFYARTEDLVLYEIVGGGVARPFNFADAEVRGGELEAVVRPIRALTVSAGYTRARTENLRDDPRFYGKELPYRPEHRVFGRLAGRRDGVRGFIEAHHQSRQFVNRANTEALPDQTALRTGAGARLTRRPYELWLSAQVDNLTDAVLLDQVGFPRPGRAFTVTLRAGPPEDDGAAGDQPLPLEEP